MLLNIRKFEKIIIRVGKGNFRQGGLTLPTRGLTYGFQGTINAQNLRKIVFHLFTGELACADGGL